MAPRRYRDGVFLSGLWRSGSTFIWSRFREANGTYCFYEPLNQGLGRLNKKRIARYNPEVTKVNTHPVLEKPYFAEFEPLMKWRGVKGFKRRFAYDRYAMDMDDIDEPLEKYIGGLCGLANALELQPVLGFNQTNFRTSWLRNNFDAYHLHVERSPREIWNSYRRLANGGNFVYFQIWPTIIERNAKHPLFAPLAEILPIREGLRKFTSKSKKFYGDVFRQASDEDTYMMTFYLWIAAALHALSYSDQVIDLNHAGESGYNAAQGQAIKDATGLKIDLSGLRTENKDGAALDYKGIEEKTLKLFSATELGAFIDKTKARKRLSEINADKADLLARLL